MTQAAGAGDVGEGDLEAFFGNNARYYLTEMKVMAASGSKVSWNWPAFLFSFLWMFYRKMWARGTLVTLLALVFDATVVFSWLTAVLMLVLGMYGNAFYLDHARRKVAEIGLEADTPEQRRARLARAGGTSWAAALVAFVAAVLVTGVTVLAWTGLMTAVVAAVLWR